MQETYRGGYLKALLDVKDMLADRSESLSVGKCMTKKHIRFVVAMLDAMIEQRDLVMQYGSAGLDMCVKPDGTIMFTERNERK